MATPPEVGCSFLILTDFTSLDGVPVKTGVIVEVTVVSQLPAEPSVTCEVKSDTPGTEIRLTPPDLEAQFDLDGALLSADVSTSNGAMALLAMTGKPALKPLLKALAEGDERVRKQAAFALARLKEPEAVPGLIEALSDPDQDVQRAAVFALKETGDPRAVDPLAKILEKKRPRDQMSLARAAAIAMGELYDESAVDPLVRALLGDDKDLQMGATEGLCSLEYMAVSPLIWLLTERRDDVREAAAFALGWKGNEAAVEPLIDVAVRDEVFYVRKTAIESLGEIGDSRAVPALGKLFNSGGGSSLGVLLAQSAAKALGMINDGSTVPSLANAISETDSYRMEVAADALSAIGEPAVEAFLELLDAEEDFWSRVVIVDKLARIGEPAVEALIGLLERPEGYIRETAARMLSLAGDKRAVGPLIKALGDELELVRQRAAGTLSSIPDERAVEPLIAALSDSYSLVRSAAAEALGIIGDARAAGPLNKALSDEDETVRWTAVVALGRIGDGAALPSLKALLAEDDWGKDASSTGISAAAAIALGELGGDEAAAALSGALGGKDTRVVARSLAKAGDAGVNFLLDALGDHRESVRTQVAEALTEVGEPVVIPLARTIAEGSDHAREAAATALSFVAYGKPSVEGLKSRLLYGSPDRRPE
jgi:HEAT repeat protein